MPAFTFSPLPRHATLWRVLQAVLLVGMIAPWALFTGLPATRAADPPERVVDGLQALYTFEALVKGVIPDRAGVGEGIDLRIDKPQGVRFHAGRMGLDLPVVVASDGPAARLTQALRQAQQFSLEVWITPAEPDQTGPARIVSLSLDTSKRSLSLVQDKGRYEVRLRTSTTSDNGTPSTPTPDGSAVVRRTHLVATRTPDGVVRIALDGKEVAQNTVAGDMNRWPDDCRLVVGNEVSGDRPWRGEIALLALYSRALTADEIGRNFAVGPPQIEEAVALPPAYFGAVDFVADVLPILSSRCFDCHAGDEEAGGLNLAIRARALQGGFHGALIEPGESLSSRLVHSIAGIAKAKPMPPDGPPLSAAEIGIIRAWIDQGAVWPAGHDLPDPREERAREHWAFRLLEDVAVPAVDDAVWPRTDIDRFILAKLEESGIKPSPAADPRTLIRRMTFDLTGLPPTPDEVEAFSIAHANDSDGAIAALADRLLASVAHGERWARHWLDIARYADSDGQEGDRDRPHAWRYRDFLIRSIQDDIPFDRFVRWQIAGDEEAPDDSQALAATGFLTAGPSSVLPESLMEDERLRSRYNELDDTLATVGSGFLGLTLGCVRCHDHKYDFLPARDYYGMLSAFHSGSRAEVPLVAGNETEKALVWRDAGPEPRTTWLFQRGDWYDRDQPVSLSFVGVLSRGRSADDYLRAAKESSPHRDTTYQRKALADWMVDVDHGAGALLARVLVNRLWQHHFGAGIVRTVGDFGVRADPPSHPEFLEWLAADFVAHGWQVRRLERLIATSAVYRQSSARRHDAAGAILDPSDRLLARMPPRRLEAEALRDAMLAVAGTLNPTSFGPSVKPPIAPEAMLARHVKEPYPADIKDGPEVRRRSLYLFHKRVVPHPFLEAFDKPDAQSSCGLRDRTIVAPQALALLNDPFVRTVAGEFAARVAAEAGPDRTLQIRRAFQRALQREPVSAELLAAERFLSEEKSGSGGVGAPGSDQQALVNFCQVLFGSNEFFHVD